MTSPDGRPSLNALPPGTVLHDYVIDSELGSGGFSIVYLARQRQADEARGRKPGQKRNPKGGRPYKREYGEPDGKAQEKITDSQSRIMKIRAIAGSRMLWCQAILQQRCRSHAHQARALLSAGMPIHRT